MTKYNYLFNKASKKETIKVIPVSFDGFSFYTNNSKKESLDNIFQEKLEYIDMAFSFWFSFREKHCYWRTIKGVPFIKEVELGIPLKTSQKINLWNFETGGTLQLFNTNKKGEDPFNLNGCPFYNVDYKKLGGSREIKRWNYKTFLYFFSKDNNAIYEIEVKLFNQKRRKAFLEQIVLSSGHEFIIKPNIIVLVNEKTSLFLHQKDKLYDEIDSFLNYSNRAVV